MNQYPRSGLQGNRKFWDEIGYPIFAITHQLPPIAQILQVRAEPCWNTIHDFRDEIAPLWAIIYLL